MWHAFGISLFYFEFRLFEKNFVRIPITSMNHIVFDVSSDEEDDKRVDYSDFGVLGTFDEKLKTMENEDGDDDCVILDFDPTAKETVIDTCETDEVLVVGQKGEVACRDFPHPRHACAKYPFKSTLHQQFCEMCHCYVCDTRAPCPYWFSGFPSIDHCHANDKEQTWKNQREWIRMGSMLPPPVSKPVSTTAEFKRVSLPRSVPLPQNSSSHVTQSGIRACSKSARVAIHPNTYTRPGYRNRQSRNCPQNSGSQPHAVQSLPNHRGTSYNGNPSPQVVPSNPYVWTRRPSRGVYSPAENDVQNIAQGPQATHYAPPTASQGNPQRIVTGYISTVPESQSKVYAKHFNRNMYSANVQTTAVPTKAPNPPANHQQQQQQSGRSNDKVLSEFEDWLLDDSSMICPLSGQDDATRVTFDLETFLND